MTGTCTSTRTISVAIGARRLSIIDIEGGRQPLANEDGTIWAALNGEIYNHPQLRRRLLDGGHRLATRCDTEVLVHLYEDFGPDLVHALEGMFAFVIWDSRRGEIVLGARSLRREAAVLRHHRRRALLRLRAVCAAGGRGIAATSIRSRCRPCSRSATSRARDTMYDRVRQMPAGARAALDARGATRA